VEEFLAIPASEEEGNRVKQTMMVDSETEWTVPKSTDQGLNLDPFSFEQVNSQSCAPEPKHSVGQSITRSIHADDTRQYLMRRIFTEVLRVDNFFSSFRSSGTVFRVTCSSPQSVLCRKFVEAIFFVDLYFFWS
jgi:hypothetical protein